MPSTNIKRDQRRRRDKSYNIKRRRHQSVLFSLPRTRWPCECRQISSACAKCCVRHDDVDNDDDGDANKQTGPTSRSYHHTSTRWHNAQPAADFFLTRCWSKCVFVLRLWLSLRLQIWMYEFDGCYILMALIRYTGQHNINRTYVFTRSTHNCCQYTLVHWHRL